MPVGRRIQLVDVQGGIVLWRTCASGCIPGGNCPAANVRPSSDTWISSEFRSGRYYAHVPSAHRYHQNEEATYLRNNQILRKLRKPNDMIEQLLLLPIVIIPRHKLEWIILPKRPLRSLLVKIRLTQDLRRIDTQLLVSRPCTVDNIIFDWAPRATMITRIHRLGTTSFAGTLTIRITHPYQVV